MRRLITWLLISALTQPQFAQATTQAGTLQQGTGVEIELLQDVSSETLKAGQIIPFKLVRPIEFNGEVLLPAAAPTTGLVKTVRTSGRLGKSGAFNLTLEPLKLADGTLAHIDFYRPQRESERKEKVGQGTAVVLSPIVDYPYFPLLLPAALIAGVRKGKPFNIRSGERYLVYVTSTEEARAPVVTEAPKQ